MKVSLVFHMIHRKSGQIVTAFVSKEQDRVVIFHDDNKVLYTQCGRIITQIEQGTWNSMPFTNKRDFDILCTTINDESCWEQKNEGDSGEQSQAGLENT